MVSQIIFEHNLGRSRERITVVAEDLMYPLIFTAVVFPDFASVKGAERQLTSEPIEKTS